MFFYNKKNFKYILYFIFFNFYFYASENPNDEVYPNIFNANASAEGEKDLLDEKYKQLKGKNPFTEKEQIVFDGITKGLRFIGGHFFEKEKFKEFEKKNNFEKLNIVSSCINLLIVKKTDWLKKKLPNETQILLSNFIEISKNNSQTTIQDYLLSYFSNIIAAKHFHKKTDFYCFNFSDFDGTNKEFTEYDSELKQQIALNYSLFNHIKESLIRYDRSFFDECLLNKSYKDFIETISLSSKKEDCISTVKKKPVEKTEEENNCFNFTIKTTNGSDSQEKVKIKKIATNLNLLCISNAFNNNYFLNNDYVFSKEEFDQLKKEFKKTTKFNYEEFFTNSSIRFKNNPNYIFWKMNAYIDCIKRHKAPNLSGYFDSEQKINSVLSEIDNFLDCSNNGKFDNSEYTLLSKFLYFLKNKNTSTGIDIFNTAISTQNGCILSLFDFNKLITRNIQFKLTSQSNNFVAEIEKNGHQSQLGAINPLDAILNKIQNSIIRQALRDFLNNKPLDQLKKTNLK